MERRAAAAKGIWQSIFYSALIGWFVLLAILFAVTNVNRHHQGRRHPRSISVFTSADMNQNWAEAIILIACDRPVLLRHGLRDELLADLLRVLA